MTTCRYIFLLLCTVWLVGTARAQNGVNSPYSRYGFGLLSDQSTGANKGMAGLACGLRNKYQINAGNPASYSAVDSLTFLFDAGLTLQNGNFDNGTLKMNTKNSSLDYLAMQFRIFRHVGMTVGFLPYSKINYSFASGEQIREDDEGSVYTYETFAGDGGLSQAFVGVGAEVRPGWSVGANLSYLWGDINHSIKNSYSTSTIWSLGRSYTAEIKTWKADLGMQYTHRFDKKRVLTVGATYSFGHDVDDAAYKVQQTLDESGSSSTVMTQQIDTLRNAYQIPHTFALGFTYVYDNRLTVGMDYTLQRWSGVKYPRFGDDTDAGQDYEDWKFRNVNKFTIGAEYVPNPIAKNIFKRTRYRLGAYYSNPYVKVKGADMREYGVSGALVLPIYNGHSSRISSLTIAGEYVKVDPKRTGLIKENYLRLTVGLTFSETWFYKWKVQ